MGNNITPATFGNVYCLLSLLCVILLLSCERLSKKSSSPSFNSRYFRFTIILSAVSAMMDIPYAFREFGLFDLSLFINYLTEIIYAVSSVFSAYTWLLYSSRLQNAWVIQKQGRELIYAIPLGLISLVMLTTPLHHLFFSFEDGYYTRGMLSAPLQLGIFFLLAVSGIRALARSFDKQHYGQRVHLRLLFFYAMGIVLVQSVQVLVGSILPFRSIGAAALILIVTLRSLQQEVTTDGLSQINNRSAMDRFLTERFSESFGFMMLDINDFKRINDKFGHLQGDRAIRLVAKTLVNSVPENYFVARYGGDEFVFIGNGDETDMEEYLARIQFGLAQIVSDESLPFDLSVSAGFAWKDETVPTIPDLIEIADKRLYEQKSQRSPAF